MLICSCVSSLVSVDEEYLAKKPSNLTYDHTLDDL